MKHISVRSSAIVVGCLAVGALLVPGGQAIAAQITQVFVSNDAAHPVPVAGSVSVSNLPGTQTVNGTVNVGNLPAAVTGTPLTVTRNFQVSDQDCTSVLAGALDLYTVPAGKRLILDHVSLSAQVVNNGYSRAWISDGTAKFFIPMAPPMFDSGTSGVGFGYASGVDSPNAVIASGDTVSVHMVQTWRNGSNNLCSVTHMVTITGRLVD
jgi:hypothetical protein